MIMRLRSYFSLFAALLLSSPALLAQTEWVSPGSGLWSDSANWSAGTPNESFSSVRIANAGTKTITIAANTPLQNLTINRLDLLAAHSATNTLVIDRLGVNFFRMTSSANISSGGIFKIINSNVELDGTASGGSFNLNSGILAIDGGSLVLTGAIGRIGRTGAALASITAGELRSGSDLVIGGLSGSSGELKIGGGTVSVAGTVTIADNTDSHGSVTLEGGRFESNGTNMRIGDDGVGTFSIVAGTLVANDVSVGRDAGSEGTFRIQNGTANIGDLSIGRFAGALGVVQVSGGSLLLTNDTVFVGREGSGELHISGGLVHALELFVAATNKAVGKLTMMGGNLKIKALRASSSSAVIQIHGGMIETEDTVVSNGQPLVIGDGTQPATLRLLGGTHNFAHGLVISPNARLEGCGTVIGSVTIQGVDARNSGGTLAPPPRITSIRAEGQLIVIEFESQPGKNYELQASSTLGLSEWSANSTVLTGTGATLRFSMHRTVPSQFYRIIAR